MVTPLNFEKLCGHASTRLSLFGRSTDWITSDDVIGIFVIIET